MCHQVRRLMPRCYSMQYGWLGSDRDSGCLPEVRFVNTPNISYFIVVDLGDRSRERHILRDLRFFQPVTPPPPRSVTIAARIKKARQKRWGTSARLPQTTPPQRSNAPLTLFQKKCKIPSFSFLDKL